MRLGMNFSLGPPSPLLLIVLTALGLSMIVLAALIHLPRTWLFALSVAVIVLHNLLDPIQASRFGAMGLDVESAAPAGCLHGWSAARGCQLPADSVVRGHGPRLFVRARSPHRRRPPTTCPSHDRRPVDDGVRAGAGGQHVWGSVSMVRADLVALHDSLLPSERRSIRRRFSSC